jgi:ABC-2 type transport system ATP-binding protein
MNVIETRQLTKRYGTSRGIDEISLTVRPGEVFGLLGPNGAGKTTLIRTLLDLLHPTAGTATILGLDSRSGSLAIRRRIGNLPGDFSYGPPNLTGRALLRFFADLRGLPGLGVAEPLAARFRADLDRPLGQLSRGNRQKIGLIQALFHEPELVILDEPTSGLDPLVQEQFLDVIAEQREAGRTVLMSSHVLDEVQRSCDRVGIIRDGRLVAVEAVSDMVAHSLRRVRIAFADPVEPGVFAGLEGVTNVQAVDGGLTFETTGGLDAVVKVAARHRVTDLEVTHPSLEELFLRYYAHGADG